MLISIPIREAGGDLPECSEFVTMKQVWDRKRELGLQPQPLDIWGRYKKYHETTTGHDDVDRSQLEIPEAVKHGADVMHLDDWFEPDQLVAHTAREGVVEVMMNVSDFKPDELEVSFNEDSRVVTIEGRHKEQHGEYIESADHQQSVTTSDSVRAHFQRSFTLSLAVLERDVVCQLTPDGHHLLISAPIVRTLAAMPSHHLLATECGRCANLVKCKGTLVEHADQPNLAELTFKVQERNCTS